MNAWTLGDGTGTVSDAGKVKLIVVDVNNDIEALANNTVSSTGGAAGFAVADATLAGTTTGYSIATDVDYAIAGDKIVVTITSDGTGTQTSAAIAVTGAGASVTSPVTLTASTVKSYTIEITMGTAAITAIAVTLS